MRDHEHIYILNTKPACKLIITNTVAPNSVITSHLASTFHLQCLSKEGIMLSTHPQPVQKVKECHSSYLKSVHVGYVLKKGQWDMIFSKYSGICVIHHFIRVPYSFIHHLGIIQQAHQQQQHYQGTQSHPTPKTKMNKYEVQAKSFQTGHMEHQPDIMQPCATRYHQIDLW